jgi:hypothetical protein
LMRSKQAQLGSCRVFLRKVQGCDWAAKVYHSRDAWVMARRCMICDIDTLDASPVRCPVEVVKQSTTATKFPRRVAVVYS